MGWKCEVDHIVSVEKVVGGIKGGEGCVVVIIIAVSEGRLIGLIIVLEVARIVLVEIRDLLTMTIKKDQSRGDILTLGQ